MTTLRQLEARLVRRIDDSSFIETDSIADADGVHFLCPKCFYTNGGPVGTHAVLCWTPKVPRDQKPGPGRWIIAGNSIDDLSLTPGPDSKGQASVDLRPNGCCAHFHVVGGQAVQA